MGWCWSRTPASLSRALAARRVCRVCVGPPAAGVGGTDLGAQRTGLGGVGGGELEGVDPVGEPGDLGQRCCELGVGHGPEAGFAEVVEIGVGTRDDGCDRVGLAFVEYRCHTGNSGTRHRQFLLSEPGHFGRCGEEFSRGLDKLDRRGGRTPSSTTACRWLRSERQRVSRNLRPAGGAVGVGSSRAQNALLNHRNAVGREAAATPRRTSPCCCVFQPQRPPAASSDGLDPLAGARCSTARGCAERPPQPPEPGSRRHPEPYLSRCCVFRSHRHRSLLDHRLHQCVGQYSGSSLSRL